MGLCVSGQYGKAVSFFIESHPQGVVQEDNVGYFLDYGSRARIPENLAADGTIIRSGKFLLTVLTKEALIKKLAAELDATSNRPDAELSPPGTSLEALRSKVMPGCDRTVYQDLIKELVSQGLVLRSGDRLSLPAKQSTHEGNPARAAVAEKIVEILSDRPCLEIEELVRLTGRDCKLVRATLDDLTKQEKISVVNYDFAGLNSQINQAHLLLARIWQEKRRITPADFRDALSTTRKYAMALLAYFDDRHITRRMGDGRVLLKAPRDEM